jgi:hypothetical protein
VYRLQRSRRHLDLYSPSQQRRLERLGVHVWEPRPTGFCERVGDVVAVLDGFAVEEAQGGAFEGLGEGSGERGERRMGREHRRASMSNKDRIAFLGYYTAFKASCPCLASTPSRTHFKQSASTAPDSADTFRSA